jgi:hypothetical protein
MAAAAGRRIPDSDVRGEAVMGKYLGAILAVLVAAGIVGGVAVGISNASVQHTTMAAADAGSLNGLRHVALSLETFPFSPYEDQDFINSHYANQLDNSFPIPPAGDNQDWVTYWPTTALQVPTNALVTISIANYDSATPLLNPYYATPRGTLGGGMTVDGVLQNAADPNNVSHTFTIHSVVNSDQPWLFVSVPVTGVDPNAKADATGMPLQPLVTQFTFQTPAKPGHYVWQCFDPCGSGFNGFGGPMSTRGYMSGTFDVVG